MLLLFEELAVCLLVFPAAKRYVAGVTRGALASNFDCSSLVSYLPATCSLGFLGILSSSCQRPMSPPMVVLSSV